jgi:hypothetical protein
VLARPQASKLRDLRPITLEGARERFGRGIADEELLLRLTMPEEQVDAMIEARGRIAEAPVSRPGSPAARPREPVVTPAARAAAPPPPAARPDRAPVVTLLQELARRPSISHFSLVKGQDRVVWRRAL